MPALRQMTSLLALLCVQCVTPSLPEDQLAQAVVEKTRTGCGATFSLTDGDLAGSGLYAIGAYPEPGRGKILEHFPTVQEIESFIEAQRPLLIAPRHAVGTYCERAGSPDCHGEGAITCYIDITRLTGGLDAAATLARACHQKSIAKLDLAGVSIISEIDGKPFGGGQPLEGADLAGCLRARRGR